MKRIAAIVLSAGDSERFGVLDKLTAKISGRPLLSWTLEFATDERILTCNRYVAVSGGSSQLARIIEMHRWNTLFIHDAKRGIGVSIRNALNVVEKHKDILGAIVLLADDPAAAWMLSSLLDFVIDNPNTPVAIRRSPFLPHPVYLPRYSWSKLSSIADSSGLRDFVRENNFHWIVDDGPRPADVDRWGDVQHLTELLTS